MMADAQPHSTLDASAAWRSIAGIPHSEQSQECETPVLQVAELELRITALGHEGAEAIDPVGMLHAKKLLQRAQMLPQGAQHILLTRLSEYLERLQAGIVLEHEQAQQHAARLRELGFLPPPHARALLSEGKYQRLRQLARRYPDEASPLRKNLRASWRAGLDAEVEKRGLSSPGTLDAPIDDELQAQDLGELASALYRDAATSALAALTIAKAIDSLPEDAGRYHAASVATRALQTMQAAPGYLKAQLERLECLAAMQALAISSAPQDSQPQQSKKRLSRTRKSLTPHAGAALSEDG